MSRRRTYIIILCIVIALTLGFIWGNSLLDADQSGAVSGILREWMKKIMSWTFPGRSAAETGDHLLRKLAHGTEFLALGIELTLLLWRIFKRDPVFPPFCGLLVAMCDETLQLFSAGRSSQVADVWIDFGGVVTGFLLVILISRIRQRD